MLMISKDKVTEIFCSIDGFCKEINQIIDKSAVSDGPAIKRRNRKLKCHKAK